MFKQKIFSVKVDAQGLSLAKTESNFRMLPSMT